MSRLCATVLVMETVVIWLAIPVALTVDHARPGQAGVAGVVLAVVAVVLAALARRHLRWTVVGGSVLQALVIAAGVIVPVMYFLGAIFAALWVTGILLARRVAAAPGDEPARSIGTQHEHTVAGGAGRSRAGGPGTQG